MTSSDSSTPLPSRGAALELLHEWIEAEGLRKHSLAVEAAVRHYARRSGADEDLWGLAGLLHDLDWERHPEEHPKVAVERLRELDYPEPLLKAILAHAPDRTGIEPESELERTLFACDELSGFIMACARVRPDGIHGMTPKSVTKKLKDRAFAAGVSREDVARGFELLGVERNAHIAELIEALTAISEELGLRGNGAAMSGGE